jgi:hypothetical protein
MRRIMRVGPLLGLALLASCAPGRLRTASGAPAALGVLVQATAGRCTTVLAGTSTQRICLLPSGSEGAADSDSAVTAPVEDAAAQPQ